MSQPTTMSGMILTAHGGLEKLEWQEDLAVPSPLEDEVLIRVRASAVNNTDINTRTGWYSKSVRGDTAAGVTQGYGASTAEDGSWSGTALSFPRIQGADCCGDIVTVGSRVPRARIGERVLVRALQSRPTAGAGLHTATFGSECDGAFAEYTISKAEDAIAVRSSLSAVELASFPCAFSTAEGMIQRVGLSQERVLVTGASGGVGSAAIQLAKRRGALVTALTSQSKAAELRALGADETLDRDSLIPENAFDIVLDLIGGPRWTDLVVALRNGGRYATAGAIAGPIVELDLRTLYLRDLSFFGCTHQPANIFTDLVHYIEDGEIRPILADTYALRDMHAAQEAFLSKAHVGKICIQVTE